MELSAVQVSMISMSLAFCPQLVLPPIAQAEFKMILELFSQMQMILWSHDAAKNLEETKLV